MKRESMRPGLTCVASVVLATWLASAPAARAATPQQVQQAIERAQKFLLAHRGLEGTWEVAPAPRPVKSLDKAIASPYQTQWGGYTALATYALLAGGVDWRSREMQKPIHFLLNANLQSTYTLGLSSQLVTFLPEKEVREFAKRNVALLLMGMNAPPPNALNSPKLWGEIGGFYGYWVGFPNGTNQPEALRQLVPQKIGTPQPAGWYDRSNSQYAVLGMWALAEAEAKEDIPTRFWQVEDVAWRRAQTRDGGWNYNLLTPEFSTPTVSMTAAGVATLFITQDYTLEENWGLVKGGVRNEAIERGLNWMDQHIELALAGEYYTMYGVERIGTASGRKYFGTKDWFQIGADYLVTHQNADGSWNAKWGPIPDTSFGLLFLARGRAPVMMNKLEYAGNKKVSDPWNERPRDVANLAKWAGKQDEAYYNWQVVNLRVPPEELHDAPILYISGGQPLDFTDQEQAKLRTFAEEGGLILGNADGRREAFSKSFQDLGRKLFPHYAWRQAPPSDFIFTEQFKDLRAKPKVLELTNNVRKLMVLVPEADPGRAWQTHASQSAPLLGLGANIFLYATDKKNLMTKGDTYWVTPDPAIKPVATLKVARLNVGENPDPEPAGWVRMNAILHNRYRLDVRTDFVSPQAVGGHEVAHLTGTGPFTLTMEQRAALKQFVTTGGTLIVDAAGGDVLFADSAENELKAIFNTSGDLLDEGHLIFNYPGNRVEHIGFRAYAADKVADRRRAKLRGINVGRRTAVFFSREDLSAGIVGEPVDGILGYDPATATALMEGMLLYAQSGGVPPPPPATQPTTTPATQPATRPATGQP